MAMGGWRANWQQCRGIEAAPRSPRAPQRGGRSATRRALFRRDLAAILRRAIERAAREGSDPGGERASHGGRRGGRQSAEFPFDLVTGSSAAVAIHPRRARAPPLIAPAPPLPLPPPRIGARRGIGSAASAAQPAVFRASRRDTLGISAERGGGMYA
eukprot:363681-Chlamydomonas_euryale.AAC.1